MDPEHHVLLMKTFAEIFTMVQSKVSEIKEKLGGGEVIEALPSLEARRRELLAARHVRMVHNTCIPTRDTRHDWASSPIYSANPVMNPALFTAIF